MCKQSPILPKRLKILSFNVEGIKSELDDPNFIELMYKHDICLLNETWRAEDTKINLPGLWDFSYIRPKIKRVGRHSGGITIFCKEDLRSGVKVVQATEGFVWIKLDRYTFNIDKPLFICATYIPPEYSVKKSINKPDYYTSLTDSLSKYSEEGNVLIAGDFNARMGGDITKTHELKCIDNITPTNEITLKDRSSCDNTTNNYGKQLDKVCKSFNLVIAIMVGPQGTD